jgi:hypothetical protein
VTVRATGTPPIAELAPAAVGTPVELRTVWGVVLGGSLSGDVIIASPEALALVRAGRFVRALVFAGIEALRRTVPVGGGRLLCLESGIYRPIFNPTSTERV